MTLPHFNADLHTVRAAIAEEVAKGMVEHPRPAPPLVDPTVHTVSATTEPLALETVQQWPDGSWLEVRRDGRGSLDVAVTDRKPFPDLRKGHPDRPGTGARLMTTDELFMTLDNLKANINRKATP